MKKIIFWLCVVAAFFALPAWADDLVSAAQRGDLAAVNVFLAQGVDVNAKNKDGDPALLVAVWKDHNDVVEDLLAHGVDVNARNNSGTTALDSAANLGFNDVVETLLAHGADVNAKNNYGITALDSTASSGHNDVVETLLAHGADVNAKDNDGDTALYYAVLQGHIDVIESLLTHGADARDALGVAVAGRDYKSVETLLAHGAGTNNAHGLTEVLFTAAIYGDNNIIEALLIHGADVNAQEDQSCLMLAAARGYNNVVETLLAHGADVNAKDDYHETALSLAAQTGHKNVIELLMAHGADINVKDINHYRTAIQEAAAANHPNIVKALKDGPDEAVIQTQAAALTKRTLEKSKTPHIALANLLARLGKQPNDIVLRQASMQIAARISPPPKIPEDAQRHLDRGRAAFGLAKTIQDYQPAIEEFQQAANLAPWWADAYYNLAKTQEKAGDNRSAAINFQNYLAAAPHAADAEQVRSELNQVQYLAEQSNGT